MSLTGRFSTLFLAALAIVLVGFSTALYLAAQSYLHRQVNDRLTSALSVLTAAAEVHPDGVEWEPQERVLPLGQESGPDRLRWMVLDESGRPIDHSRNLDPADLTDDWTPRPGTTALPRRLVDRKGRTWRVSQSRILPSSAPPSGSLTATAHQKKSSGPDRHPRLRRNLREGFHPALIATACAPLDPTEATLSHLGWTLIGLSLGAWSLAALLCRRLSRRALQPLTRMVESAQALDATDAGWTLETPGTGDELDELGRAFNDLLDRLHLAFERQRRFSGDASHQLRTPLTILIGQIEVALRQERSTDEYRRVLRSALGRAVHLAQIVEALLFLGRAEGEAQLPEGQTFDLARWVADYLADRPSNDQSPITLRRVDSDGDPLWVRAHPPLLGQLLDNLLDNAAKYGPPGAPIVVEVLRETDCALLAVEDSGPGISPEDLPRIFEPFYRSTRARLQGTPGVGLGLAIVQRIAHTFGGTVRVHSSPGSGSRFEVRLPRVSPPDDSPVDLVTSRQSNSL